VNKILTDHQRDKEDNSPDELFYLEPKLVHHLDANFRRRLTHLYSELIEEDDVILDLMSSWSSHLPSNKRFKKVIAHGLNEVELSSNKRADQYWIQNLNTKQILPLADNSVDVCLIVAGWQYLQEPELVALELKRIIKKGGILIISFSDRAFWSKAPNIWVSNSSSNRLKYIQSILTSQGWPKPKCIEENSISTNIFLRLIFGVRDPFYSLVATND
tara:strand:- start:34 stop:681 length:648 start_codon:yes stop_codon:yes gene_type:complete